MPARPAKTLITLGLLATVPTALAACPAKTAYVAHGLVRNSWQLKPECGPLYQTFAFKFATSKWTEMYLLDPKVLKGRNPMLFLNYSLKKRGYVKTRQQVSNRSQIYLYERGRSNITIIIGKSGAVSYLALAGR